MSVNFVGYVAATSLTDEELRYSALKPDDRKAIDNSRAARVKVLGTSGDELRDCALPYWPSLPAVYPLNPTCAQSVISVHVIVPLQDVQLTGLDALSRNPAQPCQHCSSLVELNRVLSTMRPCVTVPVTSGWQGWFLPPTYLSPAKLNSSEWTKAQPKPLYPCTY